MVPDDTLPTPKQQALGRLLEDELAAFHPNGAKTIAERMLSTLYPPSADDGGFMARYAQLSTIHSATHRELVTALTPSDDDDWRDYNRLAQALLPALNALWLTNKDVQLAAQQYDQLRALTQRHDKTAQLLEQISDSSESSLPTFDEAGEIPFVHGLLAIVGKYRQTLQTVAADETAAIQTTRMALEGFLTQYAESYTNLVNVTKGVVAMFNQERERIRQVLRSETIRPDPDDDLDPFDAVGDFIEALQLPIGETWLYAEKRDYLTRLYGHARGGKSVEAVSKWASDVAFLVGHEKAEKVTREQAYAFADGLLLAPDDFPETEIEALRANVRTVIKADGSYADAWEYVTLLDELKAEPEKRDAVKGLCDRIMGEDVNLPYAVAKDIVANEAKDKLDKPESLDYLCANLATATSVQCTPQEARDYAAFMERFQTDSKRQDFARRVFTAMKGAGLPYVITREVVKGGCEKPDGTSSDELGKWFIDTTFAISQGCTYVASQTFVDTIAARESPGVQPDASELGWRAIYARGLGLFKLPEGTATRFADDHMQMQRTAERPAHIEHWYNAVTFGLQRGVSYETSRELAAAAVSRVDGYQQNARVQAANWLRFAGDAILCGTPVADATTQADTSLAELMQRTSSSSPAAGQPVLRYVVVGGQRQ